MSSGSNAGPPIGEVTVNAELCAAADLSRHRREHVADRVVLAARVDRHAGYDIALNRDVGGRAGSTALSRQRDPEIGCYPRVTRALRWKYCLGRCWSAFSMANETFRTG